MHTVVCTPSLDSFPCIEYVTSLLRSMALAQEQGIRVDVCTVGGDQFVAKARNNLINQAMDLGADSVFFIDDDQGWDAEGFLRVVMRPEDIVAGAVPKKMDDVTFNNVNLDMDADGRCVVKDGLLRTSHIGTGFMRIKMDAIRKMIEVYPEMYLPGDGSQRKHHRLFETMIIDGQFWGEDLVFCRKWGQMGGEIWVDPNISFTHVGRKAWKGNFFDWLRANAQVKTVKEMEDARTC